MKVVTIGPEQLAQELELLEREHRMPSWEFFERYQAGNLPESSEYVRWAWLCSMALRRGSLSRPVVTA